MRNLSRTFAALFPKKRKETSCRKDTSVRFPVFMPISRLTNLRCPQPAATLQHALFKYKIRALTAIPPRTETSRIPASMTKPQPRGQITNQVGLTVKRSTDKMLRRPIGQPLIGKKFHCPIKPIQTDPISKVFMPVRLFFEFGNAPADCRRKPFFVQCIDTGI